MKQYLFALAGVVAATALASDPSPRTGDISLVGFENYTAGQSVASVSASDNWSGSTDAVVTEYGNGEAPTGIAFPTPFTDAGDQYLAIDTGSDEVTCSAESSAATVYIDTLAQFSVLKAGEAAPEATNAKILLWLQEDNDNGTYTTNLYAKGGYYRQLENPIEKTYKLDKVCQPNFWYRVTIIAYKTIVNEFYEDFAGHNADIPAFVIQIDGNEIATAEAVIGQAYLEELCPDQTGTNPGEDDCLSQPIFNLISNNKLIPALGGATAATVSQVAFKGNGAIDDFVVSVNNPAGFILSWPTDLTSVFYTVNGGTSGSPTIADGSVCITNYSDGATITLTGSIGDYSRTVTGTVTAGGELALPPNGIDYFFPQTATAGQDGTAAHPFEIADVDDLLALNAAVTNGFLAGGNLNFVQIADIDFTGEPAFAGIGAVGAENATTLTMAAFEGVYDGGNHTIANVTFTNRKGSGIFNLVRNATIKDLIVDTVSYEAPFAAAKLGGAMIVGNGVNCTLQHLVTLGSNGLNNPSTYNSAGIANRLEGRGGPVLVIGCTNNAAIYGCYSKVGGICPIVQGADQPVTFVDCANTGNIVASGTAEQVALSGKTPGVDGAAGILAYTQGANNVIELSFTNCVNTGTITSYNSSTRAASILGYTTASGITAVGGSAQDDIKSVNTGADKVAGLKFATVDNGVATFVADDALVAGNTYKVMSGNATATYEFTAPGSISFNTALATPTYAITSSGTAGIPVASTSGTITTYTTGYFPRTATVGQDGTAEHPFEIADLDDLEALKAYVDTTNCANIAFVQTADIVMTNAWPGIGVDAGKDKTAEEYEAGAFAGTYDGGNYTISNFSMVNGIDYGGLFNSVYNTTIKNLKMSWGSSTLCSDSSSSGDDTGATFVGTAKGSTLQNLTALAGTVTTVTASKDMAGIVGFVAAGSTIEACTNELNIASFKTSRKCGGIAVITQTGDGNAIFRNCYNSGTVTTPGTTYRDGGIVGYVNVATTIDGCENTANVKLFHVEGSPTVTVTGTNKGYAGVASNDKGVSGLYFATVDGDVATFVADDALALNGEYKVMSTGATATFNFTAPGTISFDTNLVQAVTFAITAAEGLTLTDATANGVVTYTATGAGGDDDYVVTINGSDVVITPSAEDLAAVQAAVIAGGGTLDVTDVAAVNTALAAEIGSTGIPSWQALFLGLPPTEAGLESFKIASISFNEDGKIVMTLPSSVDPKTGRGVNIALNLMGSDDLSSWTFIEAATGTTFAPVMPASGETKKFYKVVAVFSATDAE